MSEPLPTTTVQPLPAHWGTTSTPLAWPWSEITPLPPLILADGSAPAREQTTVRLTYDREALHVHFDCYDTDIWGISTARDSAIYDEEVVEIFIAPGTDTPTFYYEFEVSPLGTLLDLTVYSPTGTRDGLVADFAWDCPGIVWHAHADPPITAGKPICTYPGVQSVRRTSCRPTGGPTFIASSVRAAASRSLAAGRPL